MPNVSSRLLERGVIEVAPIAFMRGRTLNDAFVILDEAQNTTSEQMKMFLTRLGTGSKAVVTGDVTQIDLPAGRMSGLIEALKIVSGIEGIATIYFDDRDVVRHGLVQRIVQRVRRAFGDAEISGMTVRPRGAVRRPAPLVVTLAGSNPRHTPSRGLAAWLARAAPRQASGCAVSRRARDRPDDAPPQP